jgi:hypothetical protein
MRTYLRVYRRRWAKFKGRQFKSDPRNQLSSLDTTAWEGQIPSRFLFWAHWAQNHVLLPREPQVVFAHNATCRSTSSYSECSIVHWRDGPLRLCYPG